MSDHDEDKDSTSSAKKRRTSGVPETEDEHLALVGDYRPGSIRRIKLTNFLTYEAVDFCPGPR